MDDALVHAQRLLGQGTFALRRVVRLKVRCPERLQQHVSEFRGDVLLECALGLFVGPLGLHRRLDGERQPMLAYILAVRQLGGRDVVAPVERADDLRQFLLGFGFGAADGFPDLALALLARMIRVRLPTFRNDQLPITSAPESLTGASRTRAAFTFGLSSMMAMLMRALALRLKQAASHSDSSLM